MFREFMKITKLANDHMNWQIEIKVVLICYWLYYTCRTIKYLQTGLGHTSAWNEKCWTSGWPGLYHSQKLPWFLNLAGKQNKTEGERE